ncbi:hypothetical protein D3C78_1229430 [compost metagenome]
MKIQEGRKAFESQFKSNAIYERESRIRKNNILEFAETAGIYFNIVTNNAWELWQAAQAQAAPEINGSIQAHELTISEIKAEIEEGYDLCQDIHLLDALVEAGIQIGKVLALPEGFILIEKAKLIQVIGSVSMIEPITRGNPHMDSVKRELTAITDVVKTVIEAQG